MSQLRVLAWNVKTGNDQARSALKALIVEHRPHVVALSEAYALHLPDGFCGYRVRQEATPRGWWHEPVSERGEQAALIAPGVRVVRDRVVPMGRRWVGPVNGLTHHPRRHRRLRVKVDGQAWRLSLEHWPTQRGNGPACVEVVASARAWLRAGLRTPSAVVGDLNLGTSELARMFPGRLVIGRGPDNLVGRRVRGRRDVLDHHGSDHPAVLYILTKEKR